MESKASDVRAIQILCKAMFTGQLLFAGTSVLLVVGGFVSSGNSSSAKILLIVALILAATLVPVSYVLFRKRVENIKQLGELSSKLEGYRAALIIQMALSEAAALFAIISYLLTGNHLFIIIIVLLLLNFLNLYPSKNKIIQQLELDDLERAMLE